LPRITCTPLTQDERYLIAILAKARHGQNAIAQLMNRHKSTSRPVSCTNSRVYRTHAVFVFPFSLREFKHSARDKFFDGEVGMPIYDISNMLSMNESLKSLKGMAG
jgi:hypothetical protein